MQVRFSEERSAQREKNRVTIISLVAAMALTTMKLVAGLFTGSLGLLAEAAHSGLDTVASVITFFSVRVAGRPADENHPYGHGRFENLSAVAQGALLLGTAAWILFEAVQRIFFVNVEVQTSIWAFAVMGASIVIDFWRSRMLARAAKKHNSRALEADALNFRADMFSSAVVILGLLLVAYGKLTDSGGFLQRADAWAALLVGLFIIGKSGQLALRSVNILLDLAPVELQKRITRGAESVPGVLETRSVRLRESGNRKFADIVVTIPRTISVAEAHSITEKVEETVREIDPSTESVVHVEPVMSETETAVESIHAVALQMGLNTHHERVQQTGDSLEASLHLEVDSTLTLGEAHELAQRLGAEIKAQNPNLKRVTTHLEVAEPEPGELVDVTGEYGSLVDQMKQTVLDAGFEAVCHEARLYRSEEGGLDAILHLDFPSSANVGGVHLNTEVIEQALREAHPELEHVVIHAEPREETGTSRPKG